MPFAIPVRPGRNSEAHLKKYSRFAQAPQFPAGGASPGAATFGEVSFSGTIARRFRCPPSTAAGRYAGWPYRPSWSPA